ncbi:hypothetical protein BpHYR1_001544 [Brachionus plicatilis]|uniref:Uncharacterized protein n=1 Tax=Brachionus plicatilis TaxID=10195 RepID=A0A3M7PZX7_BRAPC|nr:hypothetical protein BpHYR1_001544 [Brachionus plicatilis]
MIAYLIQFVEVRKPFLRIFCSTSFSVFSKNSFNANKCAQYSNLLLIFVLNAFILFLIFVLKNFLKEGSVPFNFWIDDLNTPQPRYGNAAGYRHAIFSNFTQLHDISVLINFLLQYKTYDDR